MSTWQSHCRGDSYPTNVSLALASPNFLCHIFLPNKPSRDLGLILCVHFNWTPHTPPKLPLPSRYTIELLPISKPQEFLSTTHSSEYKQCAFQPSTPQNWSTLLFIHFGKLKCNWHTVCCSLTRKCSRVCNLRWWFSWGLFTTIIFVLMRLLELKTTKLFMWMLQ